MPELLPATKTFNSLFNRQVAATPDHPAVIFRDSVLSYAILDAYATRIAAHLLKRYGVTSLSRIGILLNRSHEMIVSIIAVLKTGAAYVPLDPRLPAERLRFITGDADISILLTEADLLDGLSFFEGSLVLPGEFMRELSAGQEELPSPEAPDAIAYIIYTSGSTGAPKGVVIEHRSLADYIGTISAYLGLSPADTVLQQSSISFDISIEEIFPVLCSGGRLVIAEQNRDFYSITDEIRANKVTLISSTPEFIGLINNRPGLFDHELSTLRCIVSGGDVLRPSHIINIVEKVSIYNSYGPTESTVCATYHKVTRADLSADTIPIGRPLPNRKVLILDPARQLVPVGVIGEIYISGEGLAREYLNLPDLTGERFIDNPFLPGERMYMSGDLAKWLPGGTIEFAGRKDKQVKLRGYRIELGEIENILLRNRDITEAAALLCGDDNYNKFLVAYVSARRRTGPDKLKLFLARYLPDYMVPDIYVILDSFPHTINGKIDTKALPRPWEEGGADIGFEQPVTDSEQAIAAIWSEVLKRKKIDVNAHFFELGGNSLSAVEVIARIEDLQSKELSLKDIFSYPCLRDLAAYMDTLPMVSHRNIVRAAVRDLYPVSPAVQRMYLLWLLDPGSVAYNIPGLFRITGDLDKGRFEKAIQAVVDVQEILRTTFLLQESMVLQRIHEASQVNVRVYDDIPPEGVGLLVTSLIRPFDLQTGPLLRMFLITTQTKELFLFCDIHHIIFDGVSYELFLAAIQEAYVSGKATVQDLQYKDYSVWMQERISGGELDKDRVFWLEYLGGELPLTELATDRPRPAVMTSKGATISEMLNDGLTKDLKEAAADANCSLYLFMMTAFQLLLSRYTDRREVVIGTPVAGRTHADLRTIIGLFVNTLVMRATIDPDVSWNQWLQSNKSKALEAIGHQEYQFDRLVEELGVQPDISRNPLFQLLFTYDQGGHARLTITDGIQFQACTFEELSSKLDLTCNVDDRGNEIVIKCTYNVDLFERETIDRLLRHYVVLLKRLVANGEELLRRIDILSEGEQHRQLYGFNASFDGPISVQETLCSLFEQQVAKNGDRQALVYNGRRLSAREMDSLSTRMALSIIRSQQHYDSKVVALFLAPGIYTCIAMLAVLKANAAFLPIDTSTPAERLAYLLRDARAGLLICDEPPGFELDFSGSVVTAGQLIQVTDDEPSALLPSKPEDAAYIIYTSGSTGRPKGVVITHAGLVNYVRWFAGAAGLRNDDATMLLTSYSFDLGYTALFSAIAFGAALHIVDKALYMNNERLYRYLREERITYIKITPSLFSLLMSDGGKEMALCGDLRLIVLGGERLRYSDVDALFRSASHVRVLNHYGPTECTIGCISLFVDKDNLSLYRHNNPIGRAISNTQALILSGDRQLMPEGCAGEICIAGAGVGNGYLNADDLTAGRFIAHPYVEGMRLYRTGDRGRLLPDGVIDFLGRIDNEVKIRGYRIAPGEIEKMLSEYPDISQAIVVSCRHDEQESFLCGYFVLRQGAIPDIPALKHFLAGRVPEYMIPEAFVVLDAIPVTANGKVDTRRLPSPVLQNSMPVIPLQTPSQEKLAQLWREILSKDHYTLGADSDFFDLGGNSLRAARLANRISKDFAISFSLADVFMAPTLEMQTDSIEKKKLDAYEPILPIPDQEYYDLSHAQLRLWILNQISDAGIAYNIPVTLEVEGEFDEKAFQQAMVTVVERYEILRTVFVNTSDGPRQKVLAAMGLPIDIEIMADQDRDAGTGVTSRVLCNAIDLKFDLEKWPLFRMQLYKQGEGKYLLMMLFHHIIFDGWSSAILCRELIALYQSAQKDVVARLAPLRVQYRDYMAWHLHKKTTDEAAKKFWQTKLSPICRQPLELPYDRPRPPAKTFNGETICFDIDAGDYRSLTRVAAANDSTLFAGLVSVTAVLLAACTGRDSFILGTPFAGRDHHDLEDQIGLFVNMLPLDIQCAPGDTYNSLMTRHHTELVGAFAHQHYPFDLIVKDLQLPADPSRSALFDVSVVLQNYERATFTDLQQVTVTPVYMNYPGSKFDITFCFIQMNNGLTATIEYNTDLFEERRIRRMAKELRALIGSLTARPEAPVKEIIAHSAVAPFNDPENNHILIGSRKVDTQEIGKALETQPGVRNARIVAQTNPAGETVPVAYLVCTEAMEEAALRQLLADSLQGEPEDILVMRVETLPLTSWGAVDKNALPLPAAWATPTVSEERCDQYSETERKLIGIRAEVLDMAPDLIHLQDNFFDISGHSLLAIRLISRINTQFGITFSVKQLFDHPTIVALARLIDTGVAPGSGTITALPEKEFYDVSNAQLRMWVLNRFKRWANSYNIHGSFVIKGRLDLAILKRSFQGLIERHESLRTVFTLQGQDLKQKIIPSSAYNFRLKVIDIAAAAGGDDDPLYTIYRKIYRLPFDLGKGPLFKVHIIKKAPELTYLVFSMHHIISDAWSVEVIIHDLLQYYAFYALGEGELPAPLPIQYKDFAASQNQQLSSEGIEASKHYWKRQLEGPIPVLSLFGSENREHNARGKRLTSSIETLLDNDLSVKVSAYCRVNDFTVFSFFMAVFGQVVARHSRSTDLILGIPSSFRGKYSLDDQVGIYINTLPIRTKFSEGDTFRQLLLQVKENVINGMEHQDYPFDKMVQDSGAPVEAGSPPIFNIMYSFNSSALGKTKVTIPGVEIEHYAPPVEGPTSSFNLVLFGMEEDGRYSFSWVYDTDIFTRGNIALLANDFVDLIGCILQDDGMVLRQLYAGRNSIGQGN